MPRKKKSISEQKDEPFFKGASHDQISRRPKVPPFSAKEKRMMRIHKEGRGPGGIYYKGKVDIPVSALENLQTLEGIVPMIAVSTNTHTKDQSRKVEIPSISKTEEKYGKRYPRRDVIEFLNKETDNRSYVIGVNNKEVPVPYALYFLLLFLAIKLKSNMDDGWATVRELESEGIAIGGNIHHSHQLASGLNKILRHFIESDIQEELIQNMKRASKYRLSTMPSRIKTPHSKWLKQAFRLVKNIVLKERQVRECQKKERNRIEE